MPLVHGEDTTFRRAAWFAAGLLLLLVPAASLLPGPGAASVPAEIRRIHSLSPGGFIFDSDSTGIQKSTDLGLVWQANQVDEAGFYLRRPADWNGQTPVLVRLTFALGGNTAGVVNWRLKLNTYTPNSGEWLTNPGTRDADSPLVFPAGPSWYRIYTQTFTLHPGSFNNEPYWSLFFLRGSATNGETFAGSLYVLGAEVEYGT